ncbi:hypothetical protein D3C85_1164410 [compost metagenome]
MEELSGRADALAGNQRIAGVVVHGRHAPLHQCLARQVGGAQRLALFETAGCDDHRLAGQDAVLVAVLADDRSLDDAILDNEMLQAGIEQQLNPAFLQADAQTGDEGAAHGDAPITAGLQAPADVRPVVPDQREDLALPARGAGAQQLAVVVVQSDATEQFGAHIGFTQGEEVISQHSGIHRLDEHGAAVVRGTRQVLAVIGVAGDGVVLHPDLLAHVLDHFRCRVEIGTKLPFRDPAFGAGPEVGQRLFVVVQPLDS